MNALWVTGLLIGLAGAIQTVVAARSLRAYERQMGRLEAANVNGRSRLTTSLLIVTERLRQVKGLLVIFMSLVWMFAPTGDFKRWAIVVPLIMYFGIDTYKSWMWRRAVTRMERWPRREVVEGQAYP